MMADRIELLSVALLDEQRVVVEEFRRICSDLSMGAGWHYALDWAWTAKMLGSVRGRRVLDAGAGIGAMQWWLADHGADVISVDRLTRDHMVRKFSGRYRIAQWPDDVNREGPTAADGPRPLSRGPLAKVRRFLARLSPRGAVYLYDHDITALTAVPDASVDAVVSISALEHNDPGNVPDCVRELMRVLKPGGRLVVTLAASRDTDWYHEPSKGWCYTESRLRELFRLPEDTASNVEAYDRLFHELRDCAELRDNLADAYFLSGDNGMPWGVWDPQYLPVGICRTKPL